jgi:sarcosine oxidase
VGLPESGHVAGVRASVREHGLAARELNGDEIGRCFPAFRFPGNYLGIVEEAAGFLYVEECVRAHIDAATAYGADIRGEESVRGWETTGGSIRVVTDRGAYHAAKLVITAGAWATHLPADIGVPLVVMRQTLHWFDVGSRAAEFRRGRFPLFICETPRDTFYGFPAIDRFGLKVARHYGAPELPGPEGVNWDTNDTDTAALRPLLDEFIPGLGVQTKANVCMYTVTPDHHFVIDTHPSCPQAIIACGFSGHGFKFASTVGEVLADLATSGRTSHDIKMFSATRFR